ncbi:MAG: hypothetical protein RIC56_19685 [Pseudomonadales bacterium]
MGEVKIPRFGEVLQEHLSGVPAEAYPYLLSQLERTAAARYRGWADAVPEHRQGLLACAAREDEIADRVEAMFPPTDAHRQLVDGLLPAARDAYYAVFDGYSPIEQMTIQADAEKQGAGAWQNLKQAYPAKADEMDRLSAIELESAAYLDDVLA